MYISRLIILCFFTIFSNNSLAFLQDIETAQLKSTGGAGVGSILLNEASIFNPASIAFHDKTSIYYSKEQVALKNRNPDRNRKFKDSSRELFVLSDTSSQVKGGFSVEQSKVNRDERFRITSSASSLISKSTAMGILIKYTEDDYAQSHKTFTQVDLGLTHIFRKGLSVGALFQNPTHANRSEPVAILGIHYNLFANMDLILDAGTTYEKKPEENTLQRLAVQLEVFGSLFLRTSQFHDKISEIKGTSWGFSWVGPKLSLEYAYKSFEPLSNDEPSIIYEDEKVIENTLALVLVY
tara:strand:- start:264115 stop:264999 length:885 start_codon:yes stop_codon:yes gene_type:complete